MKQRDSRPYPVAGVAPNSLGLSLIERLICTLETRKVLSRRRREKSNVRIAPLRKEGVRALKRNDIPLIFLARDSLRFLPSFLKHYRGLGVTRFLCVDDRSTDGTRQMLMAEPDVDVFESNVRYRDAHRGRVWRESLLRLHGQDRWYLNVDCDEYFVYEDCETIKLPAFIAALEKKRIERCPAPMIDAYPSGAMADAHFDGSTDTMPWEVAPLFDGDGYVLGKGKRALTLRGGMRVRMFDADVELIKYPLLYWRFGHSLGISIHQPVPFHLNFAPLYGVLMHYKFFSDTAETAKHAVADNQYFDNAREYKKIAQTVEAGRDFTMASDISVPYQGSQDLVRRGFVAPIFSQ